MRETFRGSNSFGEIDLDTLRFDELNRRSRIRSLAIDFGQ